MTGYGRATHRHDGMTYTVELRSLNSKQNDLRLRTSTQLHKYEMDLRRLVLDATQRGKLEMTIEVVNETGADTLKVNTTLLNRVFDQVMTDMQDRKAHADGLYAALLRIPGIVESGSRRLEEAEWAQLQQTARACLQHLDEYRLQEGAVLAQDLADSARGISELLAQVPPFEEGRIKTVRERMAKHLEDFMGRNNVDKNRYEQEVIFYLEKMDINEEKVRLEQNCAYFLDILHNDDRIKGRKLNFISQEIGREINTLGAKAYSPDIQKLVVNMKEHLEKIKEQLANVA